MSEKNCNTNLRDGILRQHDRWTRIENALAAGLPDINCCLRDNDGIGHEMWIESKNPSGPARPGTPLFGSNHKVTRGQKNWMFNQIKAGGFCFIYIESESLRIMMNAKCCEQPDFEKWTQADFCRNSVWYASKPMPKDRWDDLRDTLLSITSQ